MRLLSNVYLRIRASNEKESLRMCPGIHTSQKQNVENLTVPSNALQPTKQCFMYAYTKKTTEKLPFNDLVHMYI